MQQQSKIGVIEFVKTSAAVVALGARALDYPREVNEVGLGSDVIADASICNE